MARGTNSGGRKRVFGAGKFSKMLTTGDCCGYAGHSAVIEDSPGRVETPYKTALERFYEKWPNCDEMKLGLGHETSRTTYID